MRRNIKLQLKYKKNSKIGLPRKKEKIVELNTLYTYRKKPQ